MEPYHGEVSLRLPLAPRLARLVSSTVEESARGLGLESSDAVMLSLAGEEVYGYLCQVLPAGSALDLTFSGHVYYVRLAMSFPHANLDLRLFNLTAGFSADNQDDLAKLGLLIAARTVESFSLEPDGAGRMTLLLDKHKNYPPAEGAPAPPPALDRARVAVPGPAEIKELARLLAGFFPAEAYPADFALPGKLADMVQSGEYGILAVEDAQGGLGGMVVWRPLGQSIRLYGPYLFAQAAAKRLGRELVEACLGRVAKSGANSLVCRYAGNGLPEDQFELLGDLALPRPDGGLRSWPSYFRQLREDPGSWAWCHPDLRPFLEGQYRKLFLPRGIRELSHQGEARPEHSVLAVELKRGQDLATLRPVWDGADLTANLRAHHQILAGEGFANLVLTLDTGSQWQAGLASQVMAAGFTPRLILPGQATGDLVVFQREAR